MNEFRRPPRLRQLIEPVEIALPTPPTTPRPNRRPPLGRVLMIGMVPALLPAIGFGAVAVVTSAPMSTVLPMAGMMGSMAIAVGITTTFSRRDEDARIESEQREHDSLREAYEDSLTASAAEAARAVQREAQVGATSFPGPSELLQDAIALSPSIWERRASDDDFLELRVGTGRKKSCVKFTHPGATPDASARAVIDRLSWHEEAPLSLKLALGKQTGMFGTREQLNPMLCWLTFQAAAFHAPWELSIVVLSRDEDLCAWAKWLPHCSFKNKSEFQPLVARSGGEATDALRAVANDLRSRSADEDGPSYLVIADGRGWPTLESRLERLLPAGSKSIATLLVQNELAELSGDCEAVIDISQPFGLILKRLDDGEPPLFAPDVMWSNDAARGALSLASIKIAAGERHTPIPSTARLGDLLGGSAASAASIEDTWEKTRQRFRLAAPIGVGPDDAPVEIDLRRDGPHGLLAGTTGSGKSEFLQSLVVALSARIPPDLLNFVLIDYKGGSAFREVSGLPHVVGVVTDLDDRLAARALTSLRSEMKRRETLFSTVQPASNNIIEYQSAPRQEPLANLVIIIDEFHRLVSEQPDFIDEMVQIAQQGRSLGIHLLLATQKPSGVITDHIRANTNLRICLRVTDEADSRDVLGGPEAALIPRDLPGRVYMRVGNEALRVCQAGRVSGMVAPQQRLQADVQVHSFLPPLTPPTFQHGTLLVQAIGSAVREVEDEIVDTELIDERAALIEAIKGAAMRAGFPDQGAPWQPHLPERIDLSELSPAKANDRGPAAIAIGVLDEPELQRQQTFAVDLEAGHVCVAGGSNTGKTTTLLTIAAAAAQRWSPDELHIYGIDFAGGGLLPLEELPHCGGIALQHDAARVHWTLQAIKDFAVERLRRVGGAAAAGPAPARILVLVDNFPSLYAAIQNSDEGQDAADDLSEVLDAGRSVGITFVISVERPEALRAQVVSLMQTKLVFDLPDQTGYAVFGLGQVRKTAQAIQGRAVLPGRFLHEVQVALPDATIEKLRSAPHSSEAGGPLKVAPLSPIVPYAGLLAAVAKGGAATGLHVGLAEGTHPLFVHPAGTHLMILGPRRSGRSNGLAVATLETRRLSKTSTFIINPRRSAALRSISTEEATKSLPGAYAERLPDIEALFGQIADEVASRQREYAGGREAFEPWAIIIDDIDVLELPPVANDALQQLALRGADLGATLIVGADSQALRSAYPSGVTRALLNQRTGILLAPTTPEDFDFFGVRGRPSRLPPGRGYYCTAGAKHAVQLALIETEQAPDGR